MDRTKEQIKFNIEILKLVVVLMIATGGGAIALILEGFEKVRDVIIAAGGMIIAIMCLIITYIRYKITQNLIDSL